MKVKVKEIEDTDYCEGKGLDEEECEGKYYGVDSGTPAGWTPFCSKHFMKFNKVIEVEGRMWVEVTIE